MIDKTAAQHVQMAEKQIKHLLDSEGQKSSPERDRECKELCVSIGMSLFMALLCQLGAEKKYSIAASKCPADRLGL